MQIGFARRFRPQEENSVGTNRQAEASRENGRRSRGPTSPDGKTRTRLNALKNGLFSRETLIPGESVEDFIALRDVVWQQFEPRDATTVILVNELVNSQWRLLRVRRCEAGEIRIRLETGRYRWRCERMARVNSWKSCLLRHHIAKYAYRTGAQELDPRIIAASIEDARVQLKKTAAGVEFLTNQIKAIESVVKVQGYIPQEYLMMLIDVCGIEDDFALRCFLLNKIAQAEMAKSENAKNAGDSIFEINKEILLRAISSEIGNLVIVTKTLEQIESVEEEAHLATLVLPTAERADRVHRAEAALQRSLYRALDRLMAV